MANLNQKIPIQASPSIVSYNYTDISDGTGVIVFNGASHREASTTALYLTTATPYSADIIVSGAFVTGGPATGLILDKNFDVTFNRPQRIKGKAYLNVTMGGTGDTGNGTPTIFISGGSLSNATTGETLASIGNLNNQSLDLSVPSLGTHSKVLNIELDASNKVYIFKANDTLRLNIELWGTLTGTSPIVYGGIGADPADRNDPDGLTILDADPTTLTLAIPFQPLD